MTLSIPSTRMFAFRMPSIQQRTLALQQHGANAGLYLTNGYVMSEVIKAACSSARTRMPKVVKDVFRST